MGRIVKERNTFHHTNKETRFTDMNPTYRNYSPNIRCKSKKLSILENLGIFELRTKTPDKLLNVQIDCLSETIFMHYNDTIEYKPRRTE